jgi:hypothetical protein
MSGPAFTPMSRAANRTGSPPPTQGEIRGQIVDDVRPQHPDAGDLPERKEVLTGSRRGGEERAGPECFGAPTARKRPEAKTTSCHGTSAQRRDVGERHEKTTASTRLRRLPASTAGCR